MQPLQPIAIPSRTEHALHAIKSGILSGYFPPGQALVEVDLARELGTSKTPVREALRSLENSGLVVIRPYSGVRVRTLTPDDAIAIYDARLALEPEAVRRSVAAGADQAAAREALAAADAAADPIERSLANRAFHAALWEGAGNAVIIEMLESLRDRTALAAIGTWAKKPTWAGEADEHANILAAAESGDAALAAELTARHIGGFLERLREERPDA